MSEGLRPWQAFKQPIITPTSKAEVGSHDENTTPDEILSSGLCTKEQWEKILKISLELFQFGSLIYKEHGWILVDTKYEFGFDDEGEPFLVDEVHTPDSSRLWVSDSYEKRLSQGKSPQMLDKEIIRNYLKKKGFTGEGSVPVVPESKILELSQVYLSVAEKLCGKPLGLDKNLVLN